MQKITHESILAMGKYDRLSLEGISDHIVWRLYEFMLRLRKCEEALMEEYHPADEMRCPVHFCVGQEAIPAALALLIGKDDYLFSHHRSHGYYLAKNGPMRYLFAEIYGKASGANGGLAGSQDISLHSHKFYSGAILAGAIAVSVGTAMTSNYSGEGKVTVAGFGEAASEEGIFAEAVNLAVSRKLPVIFVCENNRYSVYSHHLERQQEDNLADRVKAMGIESKAIFGNDVIKAYDSLSEAFNFVRNNGGPYFLEAYTYRKYGHVGPEDDDVFNYRPQKERDFWEANCPISLLEASMIEKGLLSPSSKKDLLNKIASEVDESFTFAKESPFPDPANWNDLNYSSSTPMADRLLTDIENEEFDETQDLTLPKPY